MSHFLRISFFVALTVLFSGGLTESAASDPFFAAPTTIADLGSNTRPFGVAAGDFDGDGRVDLVVGRTTGHVAFVRGYGDGTFAAPSEFAWKLAYFNAWSFVAADVNGDNLLDVVWAATAASSGCSVSPVPSTGCPLTISVNDADVRVLYGNGNGTFQETTYFASGVRHNAGTLLGRVGTVGAGGLAAGDVDADGDVDLVAGAVEGANSVVKLLRNNGSAFALETILSQPTATSGDAASPTYFPAIGIRNSPWGLAIADADADGDLDLWIGDRALYLYLFANNGSGAFTCVTGYSPYSNRPNVYRVHDSWRPDVGYTPSMAAGDVNDDNRADVFLGLLSGGQAATSTLAHDGELLLDVSAASGHVSLGTISDFGMVTRGVTLIDVDGDGARDVIAAEYGGKVKLLRQLPPIDTDIDGVSDYVDNALDFGNPPRLDMNTDGSVNYRDQLDNDADTVLGNPEDRTTWVRLGDPVDPDDDNDGVFDSSDNCPFVANGNQADVDGDTIGDACDPLDDGDADGDNVPDGPRPGELLFDRTIAAKAKWASGTTHFVIRIDALGRFFQNEFTQIMTDAAVLAPADWAAKCWENYEPSDITGYEPCGTGEGTADQALTLPGGKEVPISLVTIPKQLWTDPPVVGWINDRNDNARFELAQHATYHGDNTPLGDWRELADRNFYSCEICGLTDGENFELLKVGFDTLAGNYDNAWVSQSGASASSPKIDWSTSFWPLLSFSPPYNTSDAAGRKAAAQLGFKAFSASWFEEAGSYAPIFSPEGSHHEQFDQFGMFHASADVQLYPPDTTGDTYNTGAYADYLASQTDAGGLTTWLIEEVDWSGRPCPNDNRLGLCNGQSNRENNTVYLPRWNAWMQVLDFVKTYPGGVAMTMAEVALAKGFDNAPTVANADQADGDADGIGDAIDGAMLTPGAGTVGRNVGGTLSATLTNGAGSPIATQRVTFLFDADGNLEPEMYEGTTGADGIVSISVTASRPVGRATYSVAWDGILVAASAIGNVDVLDASLLIVDPANPVSGQVTDVVSVGATLVDSDSAALAGRELTFTIGAAVATAMTDASGHATAVLTLAEPAGAMGLSITFAGDALYGGVAAVVPFVVTKEDTALSAANAIASRNSAAIARATLTETDGAPLSGRVVRFEVEDKVKGKLGWVAIGSATTNGAGVASLVVPSRYVNRTQSPLRAVFDGDGSFLPSQGAALAYRD